jgi:predicted nucleotidyltransferase
MISVLEEKRAQIEALCRRHKVRRLEVFGSAASGRFDPQTSDLDFLVDFHPIGPIESADAYFGLLEALQALLQRPVDLVMTRAITNPYFLRAVEASRQVLYAA